MENLRNDYDNGNAAKNKYNEQNTPSTLAAKQQREVTKFTIFVESVRQHECTFNISFPFLSWTPLQQILPQAVRSFCSSTS